MCTKTMNVKRITYADAIGEALVQCMEADPNVYILGIGVDDAKGIFGTTLPAARRYGGTRVIETPACENALTGMALGMALNGQRPVIIHARNDFSTLTMDMMINYAAKWRYMFGGGPKVPIVVRNIIGKGWGQGATHSQDLMAPFAYFPGLHVVAPASPHDVKGVLVRALRGGSPVVIFEHRRLYDMVGDVPDGLYELEEGHCRIVRPGRDITMVAVSVMVPEALKAAMALEVFGVEAEVIDLRSIRPLDKNGLIDSVGRTGRLLCVDPGWAPFGVPAEVAACVATDPVVTQLKCPVRLIGVADCPAPVSRSLEDAYYPDHDRVFRAALDMMGFGQDVSYEWPKIVEDFRGPY